MVLSVSEDGKRTVVVGQLGDEGSTPDGNNKTSASEGDSMVSVDTDILSKLGYGQNNASGSGSNNTSDAVSLPTGSAGSQAGESETDGTSASISSSSTDSDAEPVQDDSSATQLQMMVGLALLPVTMALLGGNAV